MKYRDAEEAREYQRSANYWALYAREWLDKVLDAKARGDLAAVQECSLTVGYCQIQSSIQAAIAREFMEVGV